MLSLFWWIIVGLTAGLATGKVMRSSGHGFLTDIVIGIAGALAGGWVMRGLGFVHRGGMVHTIFVAIGGAVILTALYRLIFGGRGPGSAGRGRRDGGLRNTA
jgi:uncharacterized membrane protein YeaQ/YmgE (transglycosylase-associated protein family)